MSFCTHCGAELTPGGKFCTMCGAPVTGAPSAVAPAPAATSAPGKGRVLLVGGLVAAGLILAAALVALGPETPKPASPPASASAPPANAPPPATPPAPSSPTTADAAPAANAGPIAASRWEHYVNTRYGVGIDYPADLFAADPPPPDNAGRGFEAKAAKARFSVYSHANAFGASREELEAEDVLSIDDDQPEKLSGDNWYALIATTDSEVIVRRVLLSEGGAMVHRLEITYPKSSAKAFQPVVARMMESFSVDPSIPEKAAEAARAAGRGAPGSPPPPPSSGRTAQSQPPPPQVAAAPPPTFASWRTIDFVSAGLQLAGNRSEPRVSAQLPAHWVKADMPEPNVVLFEGPEAGGEDGLFLAVRAEPREPGTTLARAVDRLKAHFRDRDGFRLLGERNAKIAERSSVLLSLHYSGTDSPDLLAERVAIIDAGKVLYFVQCGAPAARSATADRVFARVIETLTIEE